MSQAVNKVDWCLNKAKRELEQKHVHRGLIQLSPDLERAYEHLKKAEHNLDALLYLKDGGFEDWSTSAGFYSLYHCFLALLAKHGYESHNQECTVAAVEHLVKEKKLFFDLKFVEALKFYEHPDERHESTVIELREQFQYGVSTNVKSEELEKLITLCKEAINRARELLSS